MHKYRPKICSTTAIVTFLYDQNILDILVWYTKQLSNKQINLGI